MDEVPWQDAIIDRAGCHYNLLSSFSGILGLLAGTLIKALQ